MFGLAGVCPAAEIAPPMAARNARRVVVLLSNLGHSDLDLKAVYHF